MIMSTKIYDGKKLCDISLYELNQFYKQLRKELIPVVKREYNKLVAKVAQEIYVYMKTGIYPGEYGLNLKEIQEKQHTWNAFNILDYANKFVRDTVMRTSSAVFVKDAEPDADFDVSLCVFPIKNKILCIPQANHPVLNKVLCDRPEFIEYGYWNNTDPPSNVSASEWEQRKLDWTEALPGVGVPREHGIVIKVIDSPLDAICYLDEVKMNFIAYLIDDEKVLGNVARTAIIERKFNELMAVDEAHSRGSNGTSNIYKCLRLAHEYFGSHPEEFEFEKDTYRNMFNSCEFFSMLINT